MPSYFGQQTTTNNTGNGVFPFWERNIDASNAFVCPGSGPQIIKELSFYCANVSGTNHIRLAIYDLSNNRIAQGSAEVTISGSAGWQGHLTQASITPNPAFLNGGQHYQIAYSMDVTNTGQVNLYYAGSLTNAFKYATTDYTGGFPASLADAATADGLSFAIRCGVDPFIFVSVQDSTIIRLKTEIIGY